MNDTMHIEMYVAGELAYDNFLPEEEGLDVHGITIEEEVNKGGVATITLPKEHPCRDKFSPYSVPVEIYRNGKLRWRGRPIPPATEDMYLRRSVLCEGELCFLQDALHRPYTYSGSAAHIFEKVIGVYNAAVEPWKRFAVGNVEMVGNITLSSNEPENVLETVQTLVEQYGGYILFTSGADGSRIINWYSDMPYTCNQTVRYGDNLTGYSSQTASSDFATRIIPYGKAGEDGKRIQINNAGKDYVENAEAVAAHGIVERSVIYNDVTDPAELQTLAQRDVDIAGLVPAVIQLSTIDLSRQDVSLEAFAIGQQVPAESAEYGLSGFYYLKGLAEDLVNPGVGKVTLVREQASLRAGNVLTLTDAIDVSRKGLLSAASLLASSAVTNQSQEFIFNKLTNNGALKGLYMLDGELYVNASYLKSGVIDAALVKAGILSSADRKIVIDLDAGASGPVFNTGISTNGLTVRDDDNGIPELFKIEVAGENGKEYVRAVLKDVQGKEIIYLTEDSSWTGGGIGIKNNAETLDARVQATDASAGVLLYYKGERVAYFGVDSDGKTTLKVQNVICENINCDSINDAPA